jgi:hypothetical protein
MHSQGMAYRMQGVSSQFTKKAWVSHHQVLSALALRYIIHLPIVLILQIR